MNNQTALQKTLNFFVTKIFIGIVVVGGSVALVEFTGRFLLNKTQLPFELKNGIIGITEVIIALLVYILLFRFYEKRKIKELSLATFGKNALIGFLTGLTIQSLLILVIYFSRGYSVLHVNPASFLIPGFTIAFVAGFIAEIILRGIIFRLTEEKLGTVNALIILALLFAFLQLSVPGATILSVFSTAIHAGILLSASYVFTRSLWLSIFLHFAWDFAEPGIYGAINPGNTITTSLLRSDITGSEFLTGGKFGPENSIQAIIFCSVTVLLFLFLAKKKNNFIKPYWKK